MQWREPGNVWMFLCILHSAVASSVRNVSRQLLAELLKDDLRYIHPHAGTPVEVSIEIGDMDLIDVNEVDGFLSIHTKVTLMWRDADLAWDPKSYRSINVLRIPVDRIWNPVIQLYNGVGESGLGLKDELAKVFSNGEVWLVVPKLLKFRCDYYLFYFPYDIQKCTMQVGSSSYTGLDVDLSEPREVSYARETPSHHEWQISAVNQTRVVQIYPCCPEPYPRLEVEFTLSRRPEFYLYAYLEPVVLLSVLVSLVFMLPVADEHRYVLAMGLLVSMTLSMSGLDWMFAAGAGSIPLMGRYYVSIHILLAISIVVSTVVTNLAQRGGRGQAPPKLLRMIFIRVLGKILFVPKVVYQGTLTTTCRSMQSISGLGDVDIASVSKAELLMNEWHRIAVAVDRLTLLVFIMLNIGVLITISVSVNNQEV